MRTATHLILCYSSSLSPVVDPQLATGSSSSSCSFKHIPVRSNHNMPPCKDIQVWCGRHWLLGTVWLNFASFWFPVHCQCNQPACLSTFGWHRSNLLAFLLLKDSKNGTVVPTTTSDKVCMLCMRRSIVLQYSIQLDARHQPIDRSSSNLPTPYHHSAPSLCAIVYSSGI
jgi:hypothetical protein